MEDAYATCDGDIKAAIVEFGMNLDDILFGRFTKQAFNLTGQEWMDKISQEYKEESSTESKLSDESKTDSNAEATSEENKTMDNASEDYSTTPTQSVVFDQLIVFVTCAYAHPIQYGEDIRLSAARGENKRLEELLRRGCNPMATDGMGWTCLHHAAQWGRVDTIQLLLKHWPGINVNARDRCGWTPFMNAIAGNHKDAAMALKKAGANPSNATNYGRNALHVASMKGLADMVRLLLGLDKSMMKVKDKAGWTPMFCAVQHDELASVRLLVAAGANIGSKDGIEKTADVYGDDVVKAVMTGTKPASPRSPREGDDEEEE